ncbi:MAG: DUF1778 domain-containing protein [Cyanobacteriota bacterium]
MLQLRASAAEQRQLIDQTAAAEGSSRTEFILRSCQERAGDVLLDRTLSAIGFYTKVGFVTDPAGPFQQGAGVPMLASQCWRCESFCAELELRQR